MHRKQWWAAATVAVLAITAGTAVYRSRPAENAPDGTGGCHLLSPPSSQSAEPTSGIRIIETGYSVVGSSDPKVSMGVVLRNETDRVAYRTLVTLDALDADGRTVIADDDQPLRTQVVPLIGPGATVAVGNANLLRPGAESTIDSLAVTLRGASWLSSGDGSTGLGRVTATVTKGSGRRANDGQGEVSFSADSENCADLKSRGVSLVFRDSGDRVIGGSLDNSPPLDVCATGHHDGQRAAMTQTDIPAEADLDRTLVTIHCDFDLPRPVLSSGAPYN